MLKLVNNYRLHLNSTVCLLEYGRLQYRRNLPNLSRHTVDIHEIDNLQCFKKIKPFMDCMAKVLK